MRYDGTDRRPRIKITGFTANAPMAEPNVADEILVSRTVSRSWHWSTTTSIWSTCR